MNNQFDYNNNAFTITETALGIPGENVRESKRVSSRVHLSLFVYLLVTNALMLIASIFLNIFLENTDNARVAEFIMGSTFSLLLGSVIQYVIAFPLLAFMLSALLRPRTYTKSKLSWKEYFFLLLIGEALMLAGSIVGNVISETIGRFFRVTPENSVNTIVTETPLWAIILTVCVLAPIFEELIYRKLIMDRLGRLGGVVSVVLSAAAFALMHCNLYQIFYALAVGVVFGYVYEKTHNVLYTISMHMILNFVGSVAVLPIMRASEKVTEMAETVEAGGTVDEVSYYLNQMLVSVYSLLTVAIIAVGITLFVLQLKKRGWKILDDLGRPAPGTMKAAFANVGIILFIIFTGLLTVINLVFG